MGTDDGRMARLAEWYDEHATALFRSAATMGGSRSDAEDWVQEVFTAVAKRGDVGAIGNVRAYLFTVLRHEVMRGAMRKRNERAMLQAKAEQERGASRLADDAMEERLERALRKLPGAQRQVIAMKIDGELTFAEIGEVLGVSLNTAASRYRYAMEKLRGEMERGS